MGIPALTTVCVTITLTPMTQRLAHDITYAGRTFKTGTVVKPATAPASGGFFFALIEFDGRTYPVAITTADIEAETVEMTNYCRHGRNIGTPNGPDYICGDCEDGTDVNELMAKGDHIVSKRDGCLYEIMQVRVRESGELVSYLARDRQNGCITIYPDDVVRFQTVKARPER